MQTAIRLCTLCISTFSLAHSANLQQVHGVSDRLSLIQGRVVRTAERPKILTKKVIQKALNSLDGKLDDRELEFDMQLEATQTMRAFLDKLLPMLENATGSGAHRSLPEVFKGLSEHLDTKTAVSLLTPFSNDTFKEAAKSFIVNLTKVGTFASLRMEKQHTDFLLGQQEHPEAFKEQMELFAQRMQHILAGVVDMLAERFTLLVKALPGNNLALISAVRPALARLVNTTQERLDQGTRSVIETDGYSFCKGIPERLTEDVFPMAKALLESGKEFNALVLEKVPAAAPAVTELVSQATKLGAPLVKRLQNDVRLAGDKICKFIKSRPEPTPKDENATELAEVSEELESNTSEASGDENTTVTKSAVGRASNILMGMLSDSVAKFVAQKRRASDVLIGMLSGSVAKKLEEKRNASNTLIGMLSGNLASLVAREGPVPNATAKAATRKTSDVLVGMLSNMVRSALANSSKEEAPGDVNNPFETEAGAPKSPSGTSSSGANGSQANLSESAALAVAGRSSANASGNSSSRTNSSQAATQADLSESAAPAAASVSSSEEEGSSEEESSEEDKSGSEEESSGEDASASSSEEQKSSDEDASASSSEEEHSSEEDASASSSEEQKSSEEDASASNSEEEKSSEVDASASSSEEEKSSKKDASESSSEEKSSEEDASASSSEEKAVPLAKLSSPVTLAAKSKSSPKIAAADSEAGAPAESSKAAKAAPVVTTSAPSAGSSKPADDKASSGDDDEGLS